MFRQRKVFYKTLFAVMMCLVICVGMSFAQNTKALTDTPTGPLEYYKGNIKYKENSSYCMIEGFGRLHYWLFSVTDGSIPEDGDTALIQACVKYLESLGWTRDYSVEPTVTRPNVELSPNVLQMMKEQQASVSMTLPAGDDPEYRFLTINVYPYKNGEETVPWTYMCPMTKHITAEDAIYRWINVEYLVHNDAQRFFGGLNLPLILEEGRAEPINDIADLEVTDDLRSQLDTLTKNCIAQLYLAGIGWNNLAHFDLGLYYELFYLSGDFASIRMNVIETMSSDSSVGGIGAIINNKLLTPTQSMKLLDIFHDYIFDMMDILTDYATEHGYGDYVEEYKTLVEKRGYR